MTTAKKILAGELDDASADEKRKAAQDVIRHASAQSSILSLEPVPFLDTMIFWPVEHRMVQSIARLHGYGLDPHEVDGVFGMFRGRLFAPNLTVAAAKLVAFIPLLPDIWSGVVTYSLTASVGELSDRYFAGGRAMSAAQMKTEFDAVFHNVYRAAYREKRDELRALFESRQARQEIRDLKRAFREGKVTPEEMIRRCDEIVRSPHHGDSAAHVGERSPAPSR